MQEVCVYCDRVLVESGPERGPGDDIIPSICFRCLRELFSRPTGIPLHRFLNNIEAPVLVLDGACRILTANVLVLNILNKKLPAIQGLPGGDVFECSFAKLPGGCGGTEHCSGCAIRRSVTTTHETGLSRTRVPAHLVPGTADKPDRIDLTISTQKVEGVVVLRIDAMSPFEP
jgi:hypothetical protein